MARADHEGSWKQNNGSRTGLESRAQALCLEMPIAKLHPEVAQGNAGLKQGLIEGAGVTALPQSTGKNTQQGELLSFPTVTRRRKGPAEILG